MEPCSDHLEGCVPYRTSCLNPITNRFQCCFRSARCSQTPTRTTRWCPRSRMSTRRTAHGTRRRLANGLASTLFKIGKFLNKSAHPSSHPSVTQPFGSSPSLSASPCLFSVRFRSREAWRTVVVETLQPGCRFFSSFMCARCKCCCPFLNALSVC
jgi:hypothetical protein